MYDVETGLDYDNDELEDLLSMDLEDQFEKLWQCDCLNGCADCLL